MENGPNVIQEVQELWHLFIENEIDDEQEARLNTLMENSREARVEYIELMNMHNTLSNYRLPLVFPDEEADDNNPTSKASLQNALDLENSDTLKGKSKDKPRGQLLFDFLQSIPSSLPSNTFQIFVLLLLLLPSVFAFLTVMNSSKYNSLVIPAPERSVNVATSQNPPGKNKGDAIRPGAVTAQDTERSVNAVALIAEKVSADWGEELNKRFAADAYLGEGERFTLVSGSVELVFKHNARVVVQGPSTFVTKSYGVFQLESGRCVAHVPPMASGFTIESNGSQIVDLGTEFGVASASEMATDVYVFKGKVELAIKDAPMAMKVELVEHDGVCSSAKTGIISPKEIDTDQFVRSLSAPGILASLPIKNPSFEEPDLSVEKLANPDGILRAMPVYSWKVSGEESLKSPDIGYYLWSSTHGPYFSSGVTDGTQACVLTLCDGTKPRTKATTSAWIYTSLGLVQPRDVGHTLDLSVDCCTKTSQPQKTSKVTVGFANKVSNRICDSFVGEVGTVNGADAWKSSRTVNVSLPITAEMIGRELFVVIRAEDEKPGSDEDLYLIDNLKIEAR